MVSVNVEANCRSPTSPRSQALPVRSYICHPSATSRIWFAAVESIRVHRKKWKLRESRPAPVPLPAGLVIGKDSSGRKRFPQRRGMGFRGEEPPALFEGRGQARFACCKKGRFER